jgi:hypothetical protein
MGGVVDAIGSAFGFGGEPDYKGAAQATAQADALSTLRQLYANRPTQTTPWGTTSWTTSPFTTASGDVVDQWTQNVELTPEGQQMLDYQTAAQLNRGELASMLSGRLLGEYGTPMDWSYLDQAFPMGATPGRYELDSPWMNYNLDFGEGVPDLSSYRSIDLEGLPELRDLDQLRTDVTDQYYEQAASRLDPQWDNRQSQLEIQMRAQGLGPGDAQWQQRMADFNRARTDAYNQAQFSATQAGGQEFDRQRAADMAARQQFLSERTADVGSYNEANRARFMEEMQRRGLTNEEAAQMFNAFNKAQMDQQRLNLQTSAQNFSQALQQSGYANTLRQQAIAEQLQRRGWSLNEINALLQGQQVGMPTFPGFMGAGKAAAPNYLGAEQLQNAYNQQVAGNWMDLAGGGLEFGADRLGWFGSEPEQSGGGGGGFFGGVR